MSFLAFLAFFTWAVVRWRLSITTSSYVALEVQLMRSPWSTSGRGSFLWHSNTRAWTWPCTLRQLPLSLSSRSWAHCNLVAAGSRFKDFTSIHIHRMVYALYNVGESVLPCETFTWIAPVWQQIYKCIHVKISQTTNNVPLRYIEER